MTQPTVMVRLCFTLLILRKLEDGIHVPCRLMDNLEGEIVNEKFHECAFGYDILSADLDGEDALLLNIRVDCVFGVAHNVSRLVCCERVGKVSKSLLDVVSECISAFVSHLDKRISRIMAHAAVQNPTQRGTPCLLFLLQTFCDVTPPLTLPPSHAIL